MSRPLRITLTIVGAFIVVVILAGFTVWVVGGRALTRSYEVPDESFFAPTDSAALAEGTRLATLYGCTECHAGDLAGRCWWTAGPSGRSRPPTSPGAA